MRLRMRMWNRWSPPVRAWRAGRFISACSGFSQRSSVRCCRGSRPFFSTIVMVGGLALGVIAIVLGVVGLFSLNRASALAGVLFGILATIAFFVVPGWVR